VFFQELSFVSFSRFGGIFQNNFVTEIVHNSARVLRQKAQNFYTSLKTSPFAHWAMMDFLSPFNYTNNHTEITTRDRAPERNNNQFMHARDKLKYMRANEIESRER
jgi:mRNA degradation ribonuclease J1/J2